MAGVYLELNGSAGIVGKCGYSRREHAYVAKKVSPFGGRMVLFGKPAEPNRKTWKCGTDLVWPCIDEKVLTELGRRPGNSNIFVCRHMINAGD